MRTIFASAILTFFFTIALHAQPGFNQWYDFDTTGVAFHSVFHDEDTLIITGTALDLETNQWGTLFIKMDTLGNIYNHRLHIDDTGGQHAFSTQYQTTRTENGHLLITGVFFFDERYFIMELDNKGDIVLFEDFEWNNNIVSAIPQELVKVDNGYYLFSRKQNLAYKVKVTLTRLDQQGNVLWEKFYAHPHNDEAGLISVYPQDDNTFVIGAAFGDDSFPDHADRWAKTWIFAVDSLGNMLWDWESEQQEQESGAWGLQQLENGDWMYATKVYTTISNLDLYYRPAIVRRDSNFNLLWKYELAYSQSPVNSAVALQPSPDGHWLGAGYWTVPNSLVLYEPETHENAFFGGCLFKLTENGDSIWTQCDTPYVAGGRVSLPRLSNMVVLPSGSTIAVGRSSINTDTTWRSVGWVIKRDKHGCMEDLCVLTGVEELEESVPDPISVYPNPASSLVTFDWTGDQAQLIIMDAMGKRIQEINLTTSYQWQTSRLPDGIYFYRLQQVGATVQVGRIIIQH